MIWEDIWVSVTTVSYMLDIPYAMIWEDRWVSVTTLCYMLDIPYSLVYSIIYDNVGTKFRQTGTQDLYTPAW